MAYEKSKPILTADPWLGEEDEAYFGSWNLTHKIPASLKDDIFNSEYIWFSHGHPDHLNPGSLKKLKGKNIITRPCRWQNCKRIIEKRFYS